LSLLHIIYTNNLLFILQLESRNDMISKIGLFSFFASDGFQIKLCFFLFLLIYIYSCYYYCYCNWY